MLYRLRWPVRLVTQVTAVFLWILVVQRDQCSSQASPLTWHAFAGFQLSGDFALLCSALPPGVLFVINFLCNRSTWATNSEAGRAGGAFGIVSLALLLHFPLNIFGWSWRQAVDQSGHTSVLVMLGFLVILVLLTHYFTTCSLCWEADWGHTLVSSLIWAWQYLQVGCGEGSEHFRYWSSAASLCSNPTGEASLS